LRSQQIKNAATLLLLSQGVPMILGGDEFGRTQLGNNNPYCQDNEISWINWELLQTHQDLFRFFKLLIQFRKRHPILRRRNYQNPGETAPAFLWHGVKPYMSDWGYDSRALGLQLVGGNEDNDILILTNAGEKPLSFELASPKSNPNSRWRRFIDTALLPPEEILEHRRLKPLTEANHYLVSSHAVVVLVSS
jgi:glycogen operon protein